MEELVNKYIKERKKEDFALIYRLSFDNLYRFILSKTNSKEITDEVVSDTYFLLIDLIDHYDSTKSKFSTFLFGIALNKLRQKWSNQKANKTFSLNEDIYIDQNNYKPSSRRKELIKKIEDALPQLSTKYRKILEKRFFESKTIKTVSEELNLSISNVTTIQNRALNKLRAIINEKI